MADDPYKLSEMSNHDLYEWTAGWKESTSKYIAGQQELRRRSEGPASRRAWVAIGISGLALVVAVVALFV